MVENVKDIVIKIPSELLWGVLSVLLLAFIVITIVLHYHWRYYGIAENPKIFAKTLFWIVSIALILVMTISILIFETQI